MSMKRRVEYQVRSVAHFFYTMPLPEWMLGWRARAVLLLFFVLFSLAYLIEMSQASASGYRLQALEERVTALAEETKKLSIEVASQSALVALELRLNQLNMVPAKNIIHLSSQSNQTVAKK